MKAKLSVNDTPIAGYINIDPSPRVVPEYESSYNIVRSNFTNVDTLLFDAECEEIIVNGVLSVLSCQQVYTFLQTLAKKLSHRGRIIIFDTDLLSLIKSYLNGKMTTPEINTVLYGDKSNPWNIRSGIVSLSEVIEILNDLKLVVSEASFVEPNSFTVIGVRP